MKQYPFSFVLVITNELQFIVGWVLSVSFFRNNTEHHHPCPIDMDSLYCEMTCSTLKVRVSSSSSLSFPLSCPHKNALFSTEMKGTKATIEKYERVSERESELDGGEESGTEG